MNSLNLKVGIFVLAALGLLVAAIVVLGAGRFLRTAVQLETYIDESVQGLDVGSPVKQRGVQIGNVSSIGFVRGVYTESAYDAGYFDLGQMVLVRMELVPNAFGAGSIAELELILRELVSKGLRVRMASQGLTGQAYLEVDILPPERYPPMAITWEPQELYIPSAPSTISRLSSAAESVVRRLETTDPAALIIEYTKLASELRQTNQLVQELLVGPDIGKMMGDASAAAGSVRKAAEQGGQELTRLLSEFAGAAARLNAMTAQISEATRNNEIQRMIRNADEGMRELRRSFGELPETAAVLQRTMRRLENVVVTGQRDVSIALENIATMSENLKELSENVKRYPSQILFGDPPARGPNTPPQPRGGR